MSCAYFLRAQSIRVSAVKFSLANCVVFVCCCVLCPCLLWSGFSRQTVAILQEMKAEFSTFNILMDDEVRQGQ